MGIAILLLWPPPPIPPDLLALGVELYESYGDTFYFKLPGDDKTTPTVKVKFNGTSKKEFEQAVDILRTLIKEESNVLTTFNKNYPLIKNNPLYGPKGLTISLEKIEGRASGYFSKSTIEVSPDRIVLDTRLSDSYRREVLIHEFVHFLNRDESLSNPMLSETMTLLAEKEFFSNSSSCPLDIRNQPGGSSFIKEISGIFSLDDKKFQQYVAKSLMKSYGDMDDYDYVIGNILGEAMRDNLINNQYANKDSVIRAIQRRVDAAKLVPMEPAFLEMEVLEQLNAIAKALEFKDFDDMTGKMIVAHKKIRPGIIARAELCLNPCTPKSPKPIFPKKPPEVKPITPIMPELPKECPVLPKNTGLGAKLAAFQAGFSAKYPRLAAKGGVAGKIAAVGLKALPFVAGAADYAVDGEAEKGKRKVEGALLLCRLSEKNPSKELTAGNEALLVAQACNAKAYQGLQYFDVFFEPIRLAGDLINYSLRKPSFSEVSFNRNIKDVQNLKNNPDCIHLADALEADPDYQAYIDENEGDGKFLPMCTKAINMKKAELTALENRKNDVLMDLEAKLKSFQSLQGEIEVSYGGSSSYSIFLASIKSEPNRLENILPPLCNYTEDQQTTDCREMRRKTDEAYSRYVSRNKNNQGNSNDLQIVRGMHEARAREFAKTSKELDSIINKQKKAMDAIATFRSATSDKMCMAL